MQVDASKKVYLIVHGQRNLIDMMKDKLSANFNKENMLPASLDKAGDIGDYVAMLWPPMAPTNIAVSQVVGPDEEGKSFGMGAWSAVKLKDVTTISLK
jgi:hypothetical protein